MATVAHLQLISGIWLYFIGPIVAYILHHFVAAVHERAIRFFGMEHVTTQKRYGLPLISLLLPVSSPGLPFLLCRSLAIPLHLFKMVLSVNRLYYYGK